MCACIAPVVDRIPCGRNSPWQYRRCSGAPRNCCRAKWREAGAAMIDFSLSDNLTALKRRVEKFVAEEVIPRERDPRQDAHGPSDELRRELVARARAAGLLSPHGPKEWGGLGLDHRGMAV